MKTVTSVPSYRMPKPRKPDVRTEQQRLADELWARMDGRYARQEEEDEWARTLASIAKAKKLWVKSGK